MNLIWKVKNKLRKLLLSPCGEILMLHRVVEERSVLENNRSLEITPAFLEQTILKYKSAGYAFASLDEVRRQVKSRKRERQFVCFTFDDGYADNYELAYPVFKKHNCPFAIYVTTDFPDNKAFLWWYLLEYALLKNEKLQLNGVEYDCSDLEKKNGVFKEIINKIFSADAEITLKAMKKLFKENDCALRPDVKALSWEQISELAADPLCTIGAHTVSHYSLPLLSDEEIRKELSVGKKKIEDRIKKPVKHFAYPFGNWDNRVARLAMEQYNTATLAWGGLVRKGDALDRLNRNELVEFDSNHQKQ